ncbi:MAG: prolyl-tRNA synthetase associated domain-containing protein, partial [Methyloligellaceae bacterium]
MSAQKIIDADGLFRRLDDLGIAHSTHQHPPVFTVGESQALRGVLPGGHIKNLFLRDKKKRIWLVTALEERQIDLKALRKRLGASGSLSFGSADLLMEVLGVAPGALTPFGIINDAAGRAKVVLDKGVLA